MAAIAGVAISSSVVAAILFINLLSPGKAAVCFRRERRRRLDAVVTIMSVRKAAFGQRRCTGKVRLLVCFSINEMSIVSGKGKLPARKAAAGRITPDLENARLARTRAFSSEVETGSR